VIIWRISNHLALDGQGGLLASQRWHTKGRRIVYCAPNPATSLLEILVHFEIDWDDIPKSYQYLQIDVPESVSQDSVSFSKLPTDWPSDFVASQTIGNAWLDSLKTALLLVPCVLVPETWNVLINPLHPDSNKISVRKSWRHPLDARLLSSEHL
jgi:RES domain-containing protein